MKSRASVTTSVRCKQSTTRKTPRPSGSARSHPRLASEESSPKEKTGRQQHQSNSNHKNTTPPKKISPLTNKNSLPSSNASTSGETCSYSLHSTSLLIAKLSKASYNKNTSPEDKQDGRPNSPTTTFKYTTYPDKPTPPPTHYQDLITTNPSTSPTSPQLP